MAFLELPIINYNSNQRGMTPNQLLLLLSLLVLSSCTIKTLSSTCFCDVSSSCDAYCCCDKECSSTLIYNWNNYTLCASNGYAIPLCSYYYDEPMHTHDLYQGLRLIYTIIKRLFCISKINFVDVTSGFVSSTTDAQVSVTSISTPAVSSSLLSLANITTYPNLPVKDSMGLCGKYILKDMNIIQDGACRVYLTTATLSTNNYLSLSTFASNNNLALGSLVVYLLTTPSAPLQNITLASAATASNICTGTTCMVIKQVKLNFIKTSSSVTVDYNSSYIVMGNTDISTGAYVYVKYSYQFIPQVMTFASSSSVGYTKNSLLNLVKNSSNSTSSYYKVFNPVNLAFINTDGTCRTTSSDSDHSNIISFKFGVNAIYTCLGTTSLAYSNLKQAFDTVGSLGSSSTNSNDYVTIDYTSVPSSNQNIQLVFYYVSIGTQTNPQYQIVKAVLNPLSVASNNQFSLFVEYMPLSNSVVLNMPSPPVIDAYLPNDFLYPFYVAS